jgi:aspartate 1-decarboxylase
MADSPKAMRQVLWASVQGLTVTRVDGTGADGLVLDAGVVASAGLLAHEKVEVLNASTGARFATALSVRQKETGVVELTGPAAHFAAVGDRLVVVAFAWLKEKAAARHVPRVVKVDERNRVVGRPGAAGFSEDPATPSERPQRLPVTAGNARKARRA